MTNKYNRRNRRKFRRTFRIWKHNKQKLPVFYIKKTNGHMYATLVGYDKKTILHLSSRTLNKKCYNCDMAIQFGKDFLTKLKVLKIKATNWIFNIGENSYTGRIKAFCDTIKENNNE